MNEPPTIAPPSSMDSRWFSIRLDSNEAALWSVENVTVYAQRILGDWMLARTESSKLKIDQRANKTDSLPIDLSWKRWALEHDAQEIRFWPSFPDKALVVKTRIPVLIPPETSVDLYVNLPIWLEISVTQKDLSYTLDTIAPTTLSNTWYGTLFEGHLCYAIKSRARRSFEDLSDEPLRAVCKLHIRNRSKDSLPVEKIRIQPEHLSLYRIGERLWTSAVTVTFKGKEHAAELDYVSTPPETTSPIELIRTASSHPNKRSIIDRLFFRTQESEDK